MCFRDYINIFLKTIILTLVFAPLLLVALYLIHININFAYYISDVLNIPRDMSFTMMSAGFANNIIIVMSFFEFGLYVWIINKITKTIIYDNVKNFVTNL